MFLIGPNGLRSWVKGEGFGYKDRAYKSIARVWHAGFRVQGLGLKVQGLGPKV